VADFDEQVYTHAPKRAWMKEKGDSYLLRDALEA